MKIKIIFLFLIGIFTYQCSKKSSGTGLAFLLLGQSSSSSSSSSSTKVEYDFADYDVTNSARVNYNKIKALIDPLNKVSSNCKVTSGTVSTYDATKQDLTNANFKTANAGGKTLTQLFDAFKSDIQDDDLKVRITAVLDVAKTASQNTTQIQVDDKATDQPARAGFMYDSKNCYLQAKTGGEYKQFVDKGLFAYPYDNSMKILDTITKEAYYNNNSNNDDPKNKYTNLEKEWDKVFGYFGAPTDYSYEKYKDNTDDLSYLNSYIASKVAKKAKTDKIKKLSNHIMEKGFVAGRSAIADKKYDDMVTAAKVIRDDWSKMLLAMSLYYLQFSSQHYLDKSAAGFIPKVKQTHAVSEPYAVLNALFFGTGDYKWGGTAKYNSNVQALKTALSKFGISESEAIKAVTLDVSKVDLYALTKNKLTEARTALVGVDTDFQNEFTIE